MAERRHPDGASSPTQGVLREPDDPTRALTHGVICVAVYHPDARLLMRQLTSIADQTVRDWDCIVGIDGQDPTAASLVKQIVGSDPRFSVREFPENVGHYRNFERLVEVVPRDGAWFALADQDDYWWPAKLELLLGELESSQSLAICGQARVVSDSDQEIGRTRRRNSSLFGLVLNNQITGSTSIFRPSILDVALPFPTPTDSSYHDHWLAVCAKALGRVRVSSTLVQDYVQHQHNVLGEERRWRIVARLRRVSAHGRGLSKSVSYISRHRWGWRVEMARCLASRVGPGLDSLIHELADGQLTPRLAFAVARAALWREVPVERSLGLLIGACAWPRQAKELLGEAR